MPINTPFPVREFHWGGCLQPIVLFQNFLKVDGVLIGWYIEKQ